MEANAPTTVIAGRPDNAGAMASLWTANAFTFETQIGELRAIASRASDQASQALRESLVAIESLKRQAQAMDLLALGGQVKALRVRVDEITGQWQLRTMSTEVAKLKARVAEIDKEVSPIPSFIEKKHVLELLQNTTVEIIPNLVYSTVYHMEVFMGLVLQVLQKSSVPQSVQLAAQIALKRLNTLGLTHRMSFMEHPSRFPVFPPSFKFFIFNLLYIIVFVLLYFLLFRFGFLRLLNAGRRLLSFFFNQMATRAERICAQAYGCTRARSYIYIYTRTRASTRLHTYMKRALTRLCPVHHGQARVGIVFFHPFGPTGRVHRVGLRAERRSAFLFPASPDGLAFGRIAPRASFRVLVWLLGRFSFLFLPFRLLLLLVLSDAAFFKQALAGSLLSRAGRRFFISSCRRLHGRLVHAFGQIFRRKQASSSSPFLRFPPPPPSRLQPLGRTGDRGGT